VKTVQCIFKEAYFDSSETIVGARALMMMSLCTEAGKGLRESQAHK
jgi:hypothetical protein